MSSGLAVALLLAIMLVLLAIAIAFALILRRRALWPQRPVAGPGYKHDQSRVQYSGSPIVDSQRQPEERLLDRKKREDLRNKPLPRCGSCGTALAYGDTRCPKCGSEQQPKVEKVI